MARQHESDELKPNQTEGLITLTLTESQYSKLLDVLYQHNDGPDGQGWASSELEELRVIVEAASFEQSGV